jgi:uncharacterized protein YdaU (DUF1376 family)
MSALPYHKRYHSDALAGFMALTLEERGAYQTLLDMMYDRGGPLIDNERLLAGYMNCSVRKWVQLRQILIQKGKIIINRDGMICNNRARKEIENQSKTHRKLIEAGSKGGRTRAENEKKDNENSGSGQGELEAGLSDAQANARGSRNQKPDSSVSNDTGADGAAEVDPDKVFWANAKAALQPFCRGDPGKVVGQWLRDNGKDLTVAALNAAQLERAVNPIEYCQGYFRRNKAPKPKNGSPDDGYLDHVLAENAKREEFERRQAAAGGAG